MRRCSATSSLLVMLLHGHFLDLLTPWKVIVDLDRETITVRKRNWYLIGVDEYILAFRYVRRIEIDSHLVGADISIRATGGTAEAKLLTKRDVKRIEEMLITNNSRMRGIVFH